MKEEHAKEKSCPLLFMGNIATLLATDREKIQYKCVGSACMMWRSEEPEYHGDEIVEFGYCGLAGKP